MNATHHMTRARVAVSDGHFSHDTQVVDAVDFLAAHWPTDHAAVLAEFPALARIVWQSPTSSWFDTDAMAVDVEWSSWVTDAVENTGRVSWEDGEPFGDIMIACPVDRDVVRDWHRGDTRGDGIVGATFVVDGEPWRVLADIPHLDVWPSHMMHTTGHEDVASYIADAWWQSGSIDYGPSRTGVVWDACNASSLLNDTDIVGDVDDIVVVRPWEHDGVVWVAHASVVDRGDDDLSDYWRGFENYPIADDELCSFVESRYVQIVAEHNAPSWVDVDGDGVWTTTDGDGRDVRVSDDIANLWRLAWQSEQDYRGAADAFVDPSDGPAEWTAQIARQSTGLDVPAFPRVDDRGVVELRPSDPTATVCGVCGRGWADYITTAVTPTPSARCPFEDDHADDDDDVLEDDYADVVRFVFGDGDVVDGVSRETFRAYMVDVVAVARARRRDVFVWVADGRPTSTIHRGMVPRDVRSWTVAPDGRVFGPFAPDDDGPDASTV